MAWTKYFKAANPETSGSMSPISGRTNAVDPGYRNFASKLPEVYIGHPNRTERYNQYEQMDMDSEVNAALDIIADFCTQTNLTNAYSNWSAIQSNTVTRYSCVIQKHLNYIGQRCTR